MSEYPIHGTTFVIREMLSSILISEEDGSEAIEVLPEEIGPLVLALRAYLPKAAE